MDLPQSVQVRPRYRGFFEEQKTFQYSDSLTYLTGVQRAYYRIEGVGREHGGHARICSGYEQ